MLSEGLNQSKIKAFFEYNKENIYTNLIQAEDHARFADDLDHAQCIIKHLMFVIGELKEMENHAKLVEPDIVDKVRELRDKVYNIYKGIVNKTIDKKDLCNKIWNIRKEFEKIVPEFNTEKCESIVCSIKVEKGDKSITDEDLSKDNNDIDVLGLGELVKICWEKCDRELGKSASPSRKFKFVWDCIKEGDPVSRDVIEKMREKGWTPKAAPMCVISKIVKEGVSKQQAEEECIREGKLHPTNVYAFLAKEKESGGI